MAKDACRVLVLSASLREESLNTRLARLAASTIEAGGHIAELATMREFSVGPYDSDEEHAVGFPTGAEELRRGSKRRTRSSSPPRSTTPPCRARSRT